MSHGYHRTVFHLKNSISEPISLRTTEMFPPIVGRGTNIWLIPAPCWASRGLLFFTFLTFSFHQTLLLDSTTEKKCLILAVLFVVTFIWGTMTSTSKRPFFSLMSAEGLIFSEYFPDLYFACANFFFSFVHGIITFWLSSYIKMSFRAL